MSLLRVLLLLLLLTSTLALQPCLVLWLLLGAPVCDFFQASLGLVVLCAVSQGALRKGRDG